MFLTEMFTVDEANINQQLSRYNPDGDTYRGVKIHVPSSDDIYFKNEKVSLEPEHYNNITINKPHEPSPFDHASKKELGIILKQHLNELSPSQRKIIELRFFREMTLAEVAKVFGVSVERIRQVEAKAMRTLRISLGNKLGD